MVRPDGFVLAGGRSRRMGGDKACLVGPDGRRAAERVAAALDAVCGRVHLVRHHPETGWPWPVVVDVPGDHHPLLGVATALRAARTPWVVTAPCDLLALSPAHVAALWAHGGACVATDGTDEQPLLAVWPVDRADEIAAAAVAGASVRAIVAGVPRVVLPADALRQANAPSDLPSGWHAPDAEEAGR